MADVLKSLCSTKPEISFLIVSNGILSEKIATALQESAKEKKYKILIHQSECVSRIIRYNINLDVDFIIFAYDGRVQQNLTEVEANINKVNEDFLVTGSACLLNCNDSSRNIRLTYKQASEICNKYNLRYMCANIFCPDDTKTFSEKIFNLSEAVLGLNSGVPLFICNN